jgi:hypothetical protein
VNLVSWVSLEKPHNPSALVWAIVIVPSGARVLRDRANRVCVTPATVYWRERGPWCFSQKLDSGDDAECSRGDGSGAPLARGEGSRLSTELLHSGGWPSCGLPLCVGHQQGLVGTMRGSECLSKNTSVIHESLHIYLALYLLHLY